MSTRPIRVCHVITGLEVGGAETMLAKLCEHLDPARAECSVVSLRAGGPVAERIRAAGVPVVELGFAPGSWRGILGLRALRREIANTGAHVVQSWMYHANVAASVALRDRPVLWNIRQTLYDLRREKPLTRLAIRSSAALSTRPATIVYNSVLSAQQHEALGLRADRTRVIPNGFDTERFRPDAAARASVRRELGVSADAPLVGLVARLHPMKNHALFLRAARVVATRTPAAHFVLIGDHVTPDRLEPLIGGSMPPNVHALGRRTDLDRLTAAFDVACSSSSWGEGFSNALGEALACGVPVVATDVGDAREIVGACGALVPPDDVSGFARAIADLLNNEPARRSAGAAGRTRVIERFSMAAVAEQYQSLYELTARRAPGVAFHAA